MKYRYYNNLPRRDFLKAGVLGTAGLSLAGYLRLLHAGEVQPAKAKSAVFVWLGGGQTHMDTFDMKPDAPAKYVATLPSLETIVLDNTKLGDAGFQALLKMPTLQRLSIDRTKVSKEVYQKAKKEHPKLGL